MVVLGLGFTDHEASAALVIDGRPVSAVALERITRFKKDGLRFGRRTADLNPGIEYCLSANGLAATDVDLIVWNHVDHAPCQMVEEFLAVGFQGIPTIALPHHFAHACATYYLSPFREAAVMVADGNGGTLNGLRMHCSGPEPDQIRAGNFPIQNLLEDEGYNAGRSPEQAVELESFYLFTGGKWKVVRKILGMNGGVGGRYGAVSSLLFDNPLDAGKTMGLAPFGDPAGVMKFLEPVGPADMRAFRASIHSGWNEVKDRIRLWRVGNELKGRVPDYLHALPTSLAAGIQRDAEEVLVEYSRWLRRESGAANLCLAGGAALNCVANSRIAKESGFDHVFVPPAPGDDGIAIGCALYGAHQNGDTARAPCPVYLGHPYHSDGADIAQAGLIPVQIAGDVLEWIAGKIASGACIGWFQGGSEFGPRALGHRSILADPRNPGMWDRLNRVVKNREPFRPFAPVVLEEHVSEYFDDYYPSRYMSFIASVRDDKRALVPAITHVDGTSRYQLLGPEDNTELHALISAFFRITGIPMLLNTSFNRAGEPIVETPAQAAKCVVEGAIDFLVLDGNVFAR